MKPYSLGMQTPRQLAKRFECGELDRPEFQRLMAEHAREIIEEIEEDYRNPVAAWMETRLAVSAVKKLLRKQSAYRIREVLIALSEAPGFPLAKYLWNAAHPDIPLHCFFRIRREPVFRILDMISKSGRVEIEMEILTKKNHQRLTLQRNDSWQLVAPSFSADGSPASIKTSRDA